jgi:hypothetical protein
MDPKTMFFIDSGLTFAITGAVVYSGLALPSRVRIPLRFGPMGRNPWVSRESLRLLWILSGIVLFFGVAYVSHGWSVDNTAVVILTVALGVILLTLVGALAVALRHKRRRRRGQGQILG